MERDAPDPHCGGCQGRGAHRKFCRAIHGSTAARMWSYAVQAHSLGDQVGPNDMAASNALWSAAASLEDTAKEFSRQWQARNRPLRDDDPVYVEVNDE